MSNATKRAVLRWVHLIFAIPVIGYVYSPFAELPNYAPIVRFVSIPVLIFSGFWMYAGVIFAIIAVALWLGGYELSGYGIALVSGCPINRAKDLVRAGGPTFQKIRSTKCFG